MVIQGQETTQYTIPVSLACRISLWTGLFSQQFYTKCAVLNEIVEF